MCDHVIMDHVISYVIMENCCDVYSESLWPGGYPAPPAPERDETTKHITRVVARAKLLGSMPGTVSYRETC